MTLHKDKIPTFHSFLFVVLVFITGVSFLGISELVTMKNSSVEEKDVTAVVATEVENEPAPMPVFAPENFPRKTVIATGYYAGVKSTGKRPNHPEYGITYSGVKVRRDQFSTIAADLNVFPLGTILYIPGYGYGVVADTGSKIIGYKIDLYFETIDDVYSQWGKKILDVYVIKEGDGKVTEAMLKRLNESEITYDVIMQNDTNEP